jgi:hypothetical protein
MAIKNFIGSLVCQLLTAVHTIRTATLFDWTVVDGCDYKEQADGSLKCKRCGMVV